jgi:outer membrane protein assembly factor BamB/PKD repeat protein
MEKKIVGIVFCSFFIITSFINITPPIIAKENTSGTDVDWWPVYGHDIRHTGFSSSPAPKTNTTLYTIQFMNQNSSNTSILSGPNVVDGKLYLSFDGIPRSQLLCADAFNGSLLWNISLGGNVYFSPTIFEGRVYQFGKTTSEDPATYLFCLDAENGSILWNFSIPNMDRILSPPVGSEGKIYFCTNVDGKIYCLNSTNGTEVWSAYTNYSFGGNQASPAIADGKLYAVATNYSAGPSYVYCFNATNGSLIWMYYTPKGPGKAPTVMNGRVFVGAGDTMFCLDATGNENGTTAVLWQSNITGTVSSSSLAYGNIYFSSTNGEIHSINFTTGEPTWNYLIVGTPTAPILADTKLYVASYESNENLSHIYGYMYCLDALGDQNGTTHEVWQSSLPDNNVSINAQPAITMSTLWVATNDNWVHAFSDNHPPIYPGVPTGPTQGFTAIQYTFTATTTDPDTDNISYMWSWGDGTYSDWSEYIPSGSLITASHSWDAPGNYSVKVRARDEIGYMTNWSNGLMVKINLYQPLIIDANGPYSGKVGDLIQFNGSVSGGAPPYTWFWDFGDGNISTEQSPTHVYQVAGQFPVILTVTDATSQNVSNTTTATITPAILPNLVVANITGGFGVNAVLKNVGEADATNVTWSITLKGGFIFLGNATTASITHIQAGSNASIKSSLIIGIGKSTITVTATCDEGVSAKGTANGFVILIFVFGVQ